MTFNHHDPTLLPTYRTAFSDPVVGRRHARAPPRYSIIYGDSQEIVPAGTQPAEHEFILRSGVMMTGKPWLTMRVMTRTTKLTHKYPRIFGGESVAGVVEIKLDQPMNINSITIYLRGRMRSGFVDNMIYPFLEHPHVIWTKDDGDPTQAPSDAPMKFDGKLSGEIVFPFSFPFPTEVDIRSGNGKQAAPNVVVSTPQTFMERAVQANIEYELVLQITHGRLKSDSKLKSLIVYTPEMMPPPPSEMRQAAYIGGGKSLPDPNIDPDGWLALPKVFIQYRDAAVQYELFLAHPLDYTRGTVIPCYLAISSRDVGALDAMEDPKIHNVRLQRQLQFFEDPNRGVEQALHGKDPKIVEEFLDLDSAVWWVPPMHVRQDDHMRWVEGEIHLDKDLVPSSDFLALKIAYRVQILAPDHDIESSVTNVLLSHPVTISTANADGPIPVPFTPKPRRPSPSSRQQCPGGDNSHVYTNYGLITNLT